MEVMSVSGIKAVDECTINNVGIPGLVLMENAAQEIFSAILHKGEKYIIFCGEGNNGGDGLALARKLFQIGKEVTVVVCGNSGKRSVEFQTNYKIVEKINLKVIVVKNQENVEAEVIPLLKQSDVVVDAIFGVGLSRNVYGTYYEIISAINNYGNNVMAIDIPSGLNADTGEVMNICVKADETFTIEILKKGFFLADACMYVGEIRVIRIGFPRFVINKYSEGIRVLDKEDYKNIIPIRNKNGHKGNYGKVLVLAGSSGYTGAAFITTEAAVRTGAGLVTLVVDKDIQQGLSNRMIEAMTINYEDEKIDKLVSEATVIACGPGLSDKEKNVKMLEKIIKTSKCPLVLDADALNAISNNKELLGYINGRTVITPHPGEMARLVNRSIKEVNTNRIEECLKYSTENGIITLLKGYNTVISDGNSAIINTTGNSKMASGGMGDCLTGIITSLIAQGVGLFDGAVLGCYIHGLTGDKLSEGRYCINARDIIMEVPKIIEELLMN